MFIIISKDKTPNIRAAAAALNMHGRFKIVNSITSFRDERFCLRDISGILYDDKLEDNLELLQIRSHITKVRKQMKMLPPIFEKTSEVTEDTFMPLFQKAA